MKIRKLVEQLKSEIEKEYGVKPNIEINIHSDGENLNFKQANRIANHMLQELGGAKNMGKQGSTIWLGNKGNEAIAICSVFPEVL